MGAECVKTTSKPKGTELMRPTLDSLFLLDSKEKLKFGVKISNISLNCFSENPCKIVFQVHNHFQLVFSQSEILLPHRIKKWNQIKETSLCIGSKELEYSQLLILIFNNKNQLIEKLNLKLHLVCSGPKHHDHLLTQMKSRLMFDIEIGQLVEVRMNCSKFKLCNEEMDFEQVIPVLSIVPRPDKQCLLVSNPQEEQFVRQIGINRLKESSINVTICKKKQENGFFLPENIFEIYIPFLKILQLNQIQIQKTQDGQTFERRKFLHSQIFDKKYKIDFQLQIKITKVCIEQMQCLVYSQEGIKILNPSRVSDKLIFLEEEPIIQPWLQDFFKKLKKFKAVTYENKAQIEELIKKGFQFLVKNEKVHCESELKVQMLLVNILNELTSFFAEGEDVINEHVWLLIDKILHRPELSISCLSMINQIQNKKELGVNFYVFICNLLTKIIISINVGLTYHEVRCVQKFIAYIYFRYPWVQQKIVSALRKEDDPELTEQKLMEIGAFAGTKSPSKTMAYDWQHCLFNHVKNENKYRQALIDLEELANDFSHWAQILFNRQDDDLYYGLLIEIWSQAEDFLNYQGRIMWEYFPYYGELLRTFLGEMNQNKILDYSAKFHQCSIKLISNEKLLNSFMLHLFPKTCLYETYCVIKCLELIDSYFEVLGKRKKKMPSDFSFLYFYTGIKQIFESNHSYLLMKVLSLLYEHYHIFSLEFQQEIQKFIFYRIFYKIFLHWDSYVRRMFYYFLEFKLAPKFKSIKSEMGKHSKISVEKLQKMHRLQNLINCISKIDSKRKNSGVNERNTPEYYMRMKKNIERKKRKKKLAKIFEESHDETLLKKSSDKEQSQSKVHRKWSTYEIVDDFEEEVPGHLHRYIPIALDQYRTIRKSLSVEEEVKHLLNLFKGGKEVKA